MNPTDLSGTVRRRPRRAAGRIATSVIALLVAVALLGACGDDSDPAGAAATAAAPQPAPERTTYPLTIDNCGQRVTFRTPPKRVVILNGTSIAEVESFVKLGIQKHIVANSQSYGISDDPQLAAEVKGVSTAGLKLNENFEVPREQVLALKPDLVVSTWSGGFDPKIGSISRAALAKAGINSFVTPVNCAFGDPNASAADQAKLKSQSVESSFELLTELGRIFDVQERAATTVAEQRKQLAAVKVPAPDERKSVLVAYPGMSMMNKNGLPAIFGGGISDDIITRAGGTNPFAGRTNDQLAAVNAEALATAKVDVLVIGLFTAKEDPEVLAADLFKKFPQWSASKTKTFTSVSDGFYLGPLNAVAIQKIADAVQRAT